MASVEFPVGKSPFHTKGNLYLGTEAFFAANHPEGLRAVFAQIADPALLAFIQQKFLAGSWYDALPVASLIRAEARAMKMTVEDYLRARTEWQAKSDIHGVYRALLKLASPESVAERLPKVVARYFDFGDLSATRKDAQTIHLIAGQVPSTLAYWWSSVFGLYAVIAIGFAGARNARWRLYGLRADGQQHGIDVVRFEVEVSWE